MKSGADGIRVLHVDDEPDLADLAATYLAQEDDRIDVETALDPRAALDVLADGRVDCIVSDYNMPEIDGIEFLEAVREDYPDIPFILFTGKGSEEVASDAISAGVTDYMQKETGTDQYAVLANRVVNAVTQHRAEQRAERTRRRLEELSESVTDCLWMFDRDWEELLFISGYEAVWDRPESAIRENPQDFLEGAHREDRSFVEDAMNRLSAGESIDIEYRIRRGDDELGWVWVKGEPVFDDDGGVARVVGFTRDITDRKRRQRELETMVGNLPGIVYRLRDTDGRPIDMVRGDCEGLTGYSGAEIETGEVDWWGTVVHPEDRERVWERLRVASETGDSFEETYRIRTRDGTTTWVRERGRVTETDATETPVVEGFLTDVTDQQRREQRLNETSARLEALFEQSPDMINVHDADGNIVRPNPRLVERTGYDESELTEMAVWELDRSIDPETARDLWAEMDPGDQRRLRGEYRCRDGSTLPVEVHIRRLDTEEDRFVAISRELTAERELTDRILDAVDDLVYVYSPTSELLRWNDRLSEVTGYGDEELAGMAPTDFFPPEERDRIAEAVARLRETGQVTVESELQTADGERIPYEFSVSAMTDDDGSMAGLVGVGRDITERKRREQELRRKNDRLERFASVVSHDLRNPLNVAAGQLELARQRRDDDHLAATARAIDRMDTLVDELLTLASEGRRVDEPVPVALETVVSDCWETVETAEARLVVESDRRILADPNRLKRVLENLFANAVEHGGQTVTVGDLPDGFYVADDGPGIDPDRRDQVFEAGYSTAESGTGYGLNIVRELAAAHGWSVGVSDSETGGARIEFTGVDLAGE